MKNLKSFKDSYKACYGEMQSVQEEALYWLKNFLILFFMPVIYPVVWCVCYFKGEKGDS